MYETLAEFVGETWQVLGLMSPYLLLGFLAAGALFACIPPEWIERQLGGRGLLPVVKAAAFGVPLPLCSCGVIPVGASLRRHGASRGAATAFIISTPQTGVDSILVTYSLLGGVFAVFRPLVALVSGTIGGWLVSLVSRREDGQRTRVPGGQEACCAPQGARGRLLAALRYGLVSLPRDLARPLIVGLLIAGAISAAVPDDFFKGMLGGGIGGMVLMMLVGMPLYVCATASVPVAASLVLKGVSPGAALVFLMTGPATNAATVATVWRLLGRRSALVYLATVALTALAAGLLLDHVVAGQGLSVTASPAWMLPAPVKTACAFALLAILAATFLPVTSGKAGAPLPDELEAVTISVQGLHCSNCVASVARALRECSGVVAADIDLKAGKAFVRGRDFDVEALQRAVEEVGYAADVTVRDRRGGP
jgi:uncharacterized membrane protein YraQ (UPF0718 family)/copper chaperone CopZ